VAKSRYEPGIKVLVLEILHLKPWLFRFAAFLLGKSLQEMHMPGVGRRSPQSPFFSSNGHRSANGALKTYQMPATHSPAFTVHSPPVACEKYHCSSLSFPSFLLVPVAF
jgi:hypothetical protein